MRHNRAFTLLEISIVLLILAISAAAVTLHLSAVSSDNQKKEIKAKLNEILFLASLHARQKNNEVLLSLDLTEGKLHQVSQDSNNGFLKWELPDGYFVSRFLCDDLDLDRGKATIQISRNGLSKTFAMQFQKNSQKFWVLVAGLTGQCLELEDTESVKELFKEFENLE